MAAVAAKLEAEWEGGPASIHYVPEYYEFDYRGWIAAQGVGEGRPFVFIEDLSELSGVSLEARRYYIERDSAMAEIERLLSLEDEELGEPRSEYERPGDAGPSDTRHTTVMKEG